MSDESLQTSDNQAPPNAGLTIIVQPPAPKHAVVVQSSFGRAPLYIICPSCGRKSNTTTVRRFSASTHILAMYLTPILMCWCPYVFDVSTKIDHYCPKCITFMGTYE